MKIKKSKTFKKTLNYYKINFGFFDPFHLILDGNFLNLLVEKKMDLKDRLEKILKGAVFLQSTECIVYEVSLLGEDFRGTYIQTRKLSRIKCHTTEHKNPKDCILEVIGDKNEGKYMVGTQDESLRKALRDVAGVNFNNVFHFLRILLKVPIFFFNNESLQLEEPSIRTKKFLEEQKKAKFGPQKHEYSKIMENKIKMEKELKKKKIVEIIKEKKKLGMLLNKKAKGPNPLSIRKKIQKDNQKDGKGVEAEEKKRKRSRSRKRKGRSGETNDTKNPE